MERDLVAELRVGFERALGAAATGAEAAVAEYIASGKGTLPGSPRLLAWDANSVHAFVFDTANAAGVRGASQRLVDLDEELAGGGPLGLIPEQVLFAGGGSGVAVVAEEQAAPAMEGLHRRFAEQTLVATCSAVAIPLQAGEAIFGERMGRVGIELARDRLVTGPDPEPAVPFFAERCRVCGRRAAARSERRGFPLRERFECEPCFRRIEAGKVGVAEEEEPTDYAHIADRGGEGFLGVVYLDGNGIGRALTGLDSPLEYRRFSRALSRILPESFAEVARRFGLRQEATAGAGTPRKGHAYQRPICGGDDLVAILPGEVAVPFTRDLIARLEEAADADSALRGVGLGASAGIAIGKVRFPIRQLVAEAEALLKVAKRRVYAGEEGRRERDALAFAVVRDGAQRADSADPERWARGEGDLHLSGSPYTLEEMQLVSRRLAAFRQAEIGRSQLFALRRVATTGRAQLRSHLLYQVGRREEWRALVRELAQDGSAVGDSGRSSESDPVLDPDRCLALLLPTYGGRRTCDAADLIELLAHWREPAPAAEEATR